MKQHHTKCPYCNKTFAYTHSDLYTTPLYYSIKHGEKTDYYSNSPFDMYVYCPYCQKCHKVKYIPLNVKIGLILMASAIPIGLVLGLIL